MTLRETVAVNSAEISGATAYEVSGMDYGYICCFQQFTCILSIMNL